MKEKNDAKKSTKFILIQKKWQQPKHVNNKHEHKHKHKQANTLIHALIPTNIPLSFHEMMIAERER